MVEFFAAAKAEPTQWASAAWTVYFLSGGKPRQTAPTRLLWRLAVEGSGYPDWLCGECYGAVGDLAEMLSLLLPEGAGGEDVSLDVMDARAAAAASLARRGSSATQGSNNGSASLPTDERLAFFKLITGELRVGVSRLQVVKALGRSRGRRRRAHGAAADRLFPGAADPDGGGFRGADRRSSAIRKPTRSTRASPIRSISRNRGVDRFAEMAPALGTPSDWIVEWKFDGIRAQLLKRGEAWRLWSRGEELISDAYPDLEPLARALPSGTRDRWRACRPHPAGARVRDGFARRAGDLRELAAAARAQDRQRKDAARIAGRLHRL